jgi:hypothetical protein
MVQVMPSVLVMTLFTLVPAEDTATNVPLPKVTSDQLPEGDVLWVQVIPSGLVITKPEPETATKILLPKTTDCQSV